MMRFHGLSIGQSADVPTAEHAYIVFLPTAGKMHGRIGYNRANCRAGELRQGISIKMNFCPIVPAQWICRIRASPTIEPHAPAYCTMHVGRSFPDRIGCNAEGASYGIDEWIRRCHLDPVGYGLPCFFCLLKNSSQIIISDCCFCTGIVDGEILLSSFIDGHLSNNNWRNGCSRLKKQGW